MTSLQQLSLFKTKISDEGVRFLASARLISELDLGSTAITDACISTILNMPLLEQLGLWGTKVSDIGLQQLSACRRLKHIEIGMQMSRSRVVQTSIPLARIAFCNRLSTSKDRRLP
jgi:hypothetical protein